MTSAQGALPAFFILIALFCISPILSLRACLKRAGHVRRRGGRGLWPMAGAAVSATAAPEGGLLTPPPPPGALGAPARLM